MKEVEGDLIAMAANGQFDVIIHGCNCQCQMGKGIALSIKTQYPEAYQADRNTETGSRKKLGNYSSVTVRGKNCEFIIVNAYTQFHWHGKDGKADYEAIKSVMRRIKQDFSGKRIAYPLIGAGLAGGDWSIIRQIIDEQLSGEDHTLVRYQP